MLKMVRIFFVHGRRCFSLCKSFCVQVDGMCRVSSSLWCHFKLLARYEVQVHSTWWVGAQPLVTAVIYKNNTCLCRYRCRRRRSHSRRRHQPNALSFPSFYCFHCTHCATRTLDMLSSSYFVFGPFLARLFAQHPSNSHCLRCVVAVSTNCLSSPSSLLSACGTFFKRERGREVGMNERSRTRHIYRCEK